MFYNILYLREAAEKCIYFFIRINPGLGFTKQEQNNETTGTAFKKQEFHQEYFCFLDNNIIKGSPQNHC